MDDTTEAPLIVSPRPGCPYSISFLSSTDDATTYVVREHDEYGEYPNIFCKVYHQGETREPTAIILSDTGTGLNVLNKHRSNNGENNVDPKYWNIASFLSSTINPEHRAPYVVILTHCHYDHIFGIKMLQASNADLTILASSHSKEFLVPWSHLQKHSLAEALGIKAPKFDARWIEDAARVQYLDRLTKERRESSITVIHTPGHTPDSLSWYDRDLCVLSVGDMVYEQESDETRSGSGGQWPREPPQPIILNQDSNVIDWNASMHRLLDWTRSENRRLDTESSELSKTSGYRQNGFGTAVDYNEDPVTEGDWFVISSVPAKRRVVLSAAHVTIAADAEFALLDCLAFMLRVQLDQVPRRFVKNLDGVGEVWLWDDNLSAKSVNASTTTQTYRYSLRAPWNIIHSSSNTQPEKTGLRVDPTTGTDSRSMNRQMAVRTPSILRPPSLKAGAVALVSHSNATASHTGAYYQASADRSSHRIITSEDARSIKLSEPYKRGVQLRIHSI